MKRRKGEGRTCWYLAESEEVEEYLLSCCMYFCFRTSNRFEVSCDRVDYSRRKRARERLKERSYLDFGHLLGQEGVDRLDEHDAPLGAGLRLELRQAIQRLTYAREH